MFDLIHPLSIDTEGAIKNGKIQRNWQQDADKQNNTICVGLHYAQTNIFIGQHSNPFLGERPFNF